MKRKAKWSYQKSVNVAKAEKHVVGAALACLDRQGFLFQTRQYDVAAISYVLKPDAMRRLEGALAKLKEARKHTPADSRNDLTKEKS